MQSRWRALKQPCLVVSRPTDAEFADLFGDYNTNVEDNTNVESRPLDLGPVDDGINIRTEAAPFANAEATNFSVARIKSDVLRRSSIGAIVTNRDPSTNGGRSNRAFGADANLLFYDNLQINA